MTRFKAALFGEGNVEWLVRGLLNEIVGSYTSDIMHIIVCFTFLFCETDQ